MESQELVHYGAEHEPWITAISLITRAEEAGIKKSTLMTVFETAGNPKGHVAGPQKRPPNQQYSYSPAQRLRRSNFVCPC